MEQNVGNNYQIEKQLMNFVKILLNEILDENYIEYQTFFSLSLNLSSRIIILFILLVLIQQFQWSVKLHQIFLLDI